MGSFEHTSVIMGAKVRITEKPDDKGETFYKKPITGIVTNVRVDIYENGKMETVLQVAFTEPVEENSAGGDFFPLDDIEKIEVLKEVPESLEEIINDENSKNNEDLYNLAQTLLTLITYEDISDDISSDELSMLKGFSKLSKINKGKVLQLIIDLM
jgi:hypothetical protein